jgi:surface carbohydrate biosynthesis protein (TIGR04326 family)
VSHPQADSLLIWSEHKCDPPSGPFIVLWDRFSDADSGWHSLPSMIHAERVEWKCRYAEWLRSVGSSYIRTEQSKAFAKRNGGLEYWWMTFPTEFTFTPSCMAYRVMRTMAVIDVIERSGFRRVSASGLPTPVGVAIGSWCASRGIDFSEEVTECGCAIGGTEEPSSRPRGGTSAAFKHLFTAYWRHRGRRGGSKAASLNVVDYFDNLLPGCFEDALFDSQYWGPLPGLLARDGPAVSWRHIDVRSSALPTISAAQRLVDKLNSAGTDGHSLIQDQMSLSTVISATRNLRLIGGIGRDAWESIEFRDGKRDLDLRPLACDAWNEHHFGVTAAANALWVSLFDEMFIGDTGPLVYLMENQPWEVAMLHAKRTHGGSQTIGFVHSFVREWDLRFALPLFAPRGPNPVSPPAPSLCLVGSEREVAILLEDGVVAESILEVEALRFLSEEEVRPLSERRERVRILALGEYDVETDRILLQFVSRSLADLDAEVAYRPHPSRSIDMGSLSTGVSLSAHPSLAQALSDCDVVVAMNTSTAVLAARSADRPIVMVRDGRILEGTPLPASCVSALMSPGGHLDPGALDLAARSRAVSEPNLRQYRDPSLPRWRSLLDSLAH